MIHLESDRGRLELDPAFGARVTALWDKRMGREWLVTGPQDAGDGATYGGPQARGWDECFPTIAPCDHPAWGSLRDHGLLWGRPWAVAVHGATARAEIRDPRFVFRRTLDLHGSTLHALYEVENLSDAPFPWIWSQHCLLAARPGERIELRGLDTFEADGSPFAWPQHLGRDLSVVGAPADGFALKAYACAAGPVTVCLRGGNGGIAFAWDGADLPACGLWLDWGGWPEGDPVHQLALEPATAPAADLAAAEWTANARLLAPGARAAWAVTISLLDPP